MKKLKLLTFLFFACIIITSCDKKGEPGPAGAKGDPGPKGEQGNPGTSGIMYSNWFTYSATSNAANLSVIYMTIPVPQLTEEFINNGGTVLVYLGNKTKDETIMNGIKPLPTWGKEGYLNVPQTDAVYYELDYEYTKEQLDIKFIVTQNLSKLSDKLYFFSKVFIPENQYFRYVLIPGGVKINQRAASVDLKNYQAVKALYNISE